MAKQTFTTGQVLTAAQMTDLQQTAMTGGAASTKTVSYVLVAADAGTRVAMNAAGSTTITVNTGLFSAGDTVTIQNIGAGVCTVTAGTATVNTSGSLVLAQYQGGILYFTSASAAIFFQFATPASGDIEGVTAGVGISGGGTSGTVTITNSMATAIDAKGDLVAGTGADTFSRLAVGANNTVLTADSAQATGLKWATVSGGGMTSIATGSLTGSSISISGISGSYNNLELIIRGFVPATDGAALNGRVNNDSTAIYGNFTNVAASSNTASNTSWNNLSYNQDNAADSGLMRLNFIDYANTSTLKMVELYSMTNNETTPSQLNYTTGIAIVRTSSAITEINLFPSTGNFTSGTYILYGVK